VQLVPFTSKIPDFRQKVPIGLAQSPDFGAVYDSAKTRNA